MSYSRLFQVSREYRACKFGFCKYIYLCGVILTSDYVIVSIKLSMLFCVILVDIILCNFGDRSMSGFEVTERGFWNLPLRQVAGIKKQKPGLNRVKELELSPTHNVLLYPMLCHWSVGLHGGR